MQTPEVPTSVADLLKAFSATANEGQTPEEIQAEFDKFYTMAEAAFEPVWKKLMLDMVEDIDRNGKFGSHRPVALIAAATEVVCHMMAAFILNIDATPEQAAIRAASTTASVFASLRSSAKAALVEFARRAQ